MTGFQITTPEGADAHAHQFLDAQTEAGEHLAHLALQSLFQHHAGAAGRKTGNILGLGLALGDTHPFEQLDEHAAVECLVERDPVFLFHSSAGVGQRLAHAAIIGEDEQAFAIGIQPAYIVGVAVFGGQQVIHRAHGSLCLAAAHIATRLVEQNDHFFLRHGAAAVHFHKIGGHYAQTGGIHGLAVYLDSPFGNEAVCRAAALVTTQSQKLIQAHASLGGCGVAVFFRHSTILEIWRDKESPTVATTGGLQKM